MTPKEKADELYLKFIKINYSANSVNPKFRAIDACNILLEEIISATCNSSRVLSDYNKYDKQYWVNVKLEVDKIYLG